MGDPSLGALIKNAGFDQDYNALDTLRTRMQGRITSVEFQSNLRKTVVADAWEGGTALAVGRPVDHSTAADAKELAQKVASTLVLGLVQQQEEQQDQPQEWPTVKSEGAVSQGGLWCCSSW